jgi:ribosomal protein S18 acetylase RimI-like enzyme
MSYLIERVSDFEASWAVVEPLLAALHEHEKPFLHDLLPDWAERQLLYYASQDPVLLLIARDDEGPAGFLNARVEHNPRAFAEVFANIDNAYVAPRARRQGIGRDLLERAEAWCKEQGIAEVRLSAYAGNGLGVDFWHRAGFETHMLVMQKLLGGVSNG